MENTLLQVSEWAKERLRMGSEPPWTHYRLMQLVEAADQLRDEMLTATEDLQQLPEHSESGRRLSAEVVPLDTARRRSSEIQTREPT